jgi:prolyl 4-hydroxylase
MGITVQPKLGRAVLWPSVFDDDPYKNDLRSDHQALPVLKGLKFGANAWVRRVDCWMVRAI